MQAKFKDLAVLVVDDSPFITALVGEIFRRWGAKTVRTASHCDDAWRIVAGRAFDLIIVDWRIPPGDGLAFVRRLRNDEGPNRRVPVIMLIGYGEKPRVLEAREAGVNDFLVKPFSPKTIYHRVKAVLADPERIRHAADAA